MYLTQKSSCCYCHHFYYNNCYYQSFNYQSLFKYIRTNPLPPAPTSLTKNRQSMTVCGSCFSLWNVALESKSGTKIKRKRLCKMFLSWKLIAKSISLCSSGWKNHQPSLSWFCEEKIEDC